MAFTPWKFPFPEKKVTEGYGEMSAFRKKNKMQPHSGTDWAMPGGTKIPAIGNGTVKFVGESKILGNVIVYSIADKEGKIWYIGYCHLQKVPTLKVGDKVKQGDTVGLVGTTGSASSGNHLHATASRKVKGVFGVTTDKVDLVKLIKKNSTPPVAPEGTK
jgi:murein DD-endopeptidase MepM/ murein hydrolase activator NlpD